jgi:hypothetical protein
MHNPVSPRNPTKTEKGTLMRKFALTLLAAGLLSSWGTASAATLRLDAVSPDTGDPVFDVLFNDSGDGLLQYEEIISTSGILLGTDLYSALLGVPTIDGVSTEGGPCGPFSDRWCFVSFDIGLAVTITTDSFTYLITSVTVDEPTILSLLALGLAALVLGSRTRRTTG